MTHRVRTQDFPLGPSHVTLIATTPHSHILVLMVSLTRACNHKAQVYRSLASQVMGEFPGPQVRGMQKVRHEVLRQGRSVRTPWAWLAPLPSPIGMGSP